MYIEGTLKSGKTSFLEEKFLELINSGVSTSEILFISLNSFQKNAFVERLLSKFSESGIEGLGKIPVYTFNGLVYNSVKSQWTLVEEEISESVGNPEIIPNLCGLEISEFLIKKAIKKINKTASLEDSLRDYRSHKSLKHQILRRHTLIANNSLDKSEVMFRSELLEESMGKQAQQVLQEFKSLSARYRTFDYLKQTTTFLYLLEKNKINHLFSEIKYLLVDDFDELTYSAQFFVKNLLSGSQVKEFYIAADPQGGARRGYLCANIVGYEQIKESFPSEIFSLTCEKFACEDANTLFQAILNNYPAKLNNIKLLENSIRHVEMIEQVFARIKILVNNEKISPDDIALIIPSMDSTLKQTLTDFFQKENINYQFLTGSKKIYDDIFVFGTLIIFQLINENWNFKPKSFEIRSVLNGMLKIPTVLCKKILDDYEETGKLSADFEELDNQEIQQKEAFIRYKKLIILINRLKEEKLTLAEQANQVFTNLILPQLSENSDIEDFSNMVRSLLEFEQLFKKMQPKDKMYLLEKDWLILMKDTVVSDNLTAAPELKSNSIKIATPQKIIDFELETKVQIWIDVSDNSWMHEDTGPLYNAWVFCKNWQGDKYTPEIHKKFTREKTAHLLRKLVLLSQDKVYCYASQLNQSGGENDGGIENYLSEKNQKIDIKFEFTPREDQAPVLDYKDGKMAVSAVPGAGKTKILEALIIKMIQDGINPEEILVLTYMESAARNIRERIKTSCPELVKFPHISTIHGLALGIIKQDNNHTKLELDANFDICDDAIKYRILSDEILYSAAISQAKLLKILPEDIGKFLSNKNYDLYKELYDFFPVYSQYQAALKNRNMVDFDDLLIESVKLLKSDDDVKKHYQEKFSYIIEDEAQDSTSVQQELVEILSENHGNLIRCGDPNQAITSSFSSSDAQNFVEFADKTTSRVEMICSQRCAEEIYELANSLVDFAKNDELYKDAFADQKMQPVKGRNPETQDCLHFSIYETPEEEKAKLLLEIEKLRKSGFKFTIGVLLRGNDSVINWAEFLESVNIPYICYSESVAQKKVFRFIKAFLEVLNNPWRNDLIKILYKELFKVGVIEYKFDSAHFLEKIGSPFISFYKSRLPEENLCEFQDEIFKWLDKSYLPPEDIIFQLGNHYFRNVIDKSNARIISLLVNRFRRQESDSENNKTINLPEVLEYLDKLGSKKNLGSVKFFNEIEKDDDKYDFVQLMTVHKAKGLEFDAVFMPEMQEHSYSYSVTPKNIKLTAKDNLINQIKQIRKLHKNTEIIKQEKIHEHLRLIYVGITRARHYLYMSGNGKEGWSKTKTYEPSKVLQYFINLHERVSF